MTTAINYIDGLDGLAAGIVAIASGAFLLYADRLVDVGVIGPDNAGPVIAAAVVGACLGFLPHNFHPARIFMGDAGALTLGLLMGAATITVGGNTDSPFSGQTFFFFAPCSSRWWCSGSPSWTPRSPSCVGPAGARP
jgi:UDP-GlcNAc:undecaprenyl-phosphate/decaprenyl-phosphate GlcNAc-1-phosphate transferase